MVMLPSAHNEAHTEGNIDSPPPDVSLVGAPEDGVTKMLPGDMLNQLRDIQAELAGLSPVKLTDVEVPEQFHMSFALKEDAPSTLMEPHRSHGASYPALYSEWIAEH
jgi:hypothetical protein